MGLQEEIKERSSQIFRESYQMSIGELINLYRDEEMDIHPEFQRIFRWSELQKTKLIESIILNIPIPPIFVSQNEEGVWDIIDGLQRLSTIFQFVGVLKDQNGNLVPPLILKKTKYLPSLDNMEWDNSTNTDFSFTKEQQLSFKRARLDVNIVKKESDPNAKYELFQRLNTGGSFLSEQEVRNCVMIMANKAFYELIESLEEYDNFRRTTPISDRKSDEEYRMELILRLLVAIKIDWTKINEYSDFAQLIDAETLKLCELENYYYESFKDDFKKTFDLLSGVFSEDAFKKYNGTKHLGTFLATAFQPIAVGVLTNIDEILAIPDPNSWLIEKVHALYSEVVYVKNTAPGTKSIPRYKELSLFGKDYFRP